MLSASQMPAPETLRKANARFVEWAAGRGNVRVVPLARMQRQLMEENALDIGGARLEPAKDAPLLQRDALHPAPLGMAGLACAVAVEIKEAVAGAAPSKSSADDCTPEPVETFVRARGELKPSRRAVPIAPAKDGRETDERAKDGSDKR
jgi:hypothetical protein